jgi:hypothetical protein
MKALQESDSNGRARPAPFSGFIAKKSQKISDFYKNMDYCLD